MRRSYGIDEGYIDYLKSLGCILYSPFRDGTMLNHINGQEWYCPTGNSSYELVDDGLKLTYTYNGSVSNYAFAVLKNDTDGFPHANVGDYVKDVPNTFMHTAKSPNGIANRAICDGYPNASGQMYLATGTSRKSLRIWISDRGNMTSSWICFGGTVAGSPSPYFTCLRDFESTIEGAETHYNQPIAADNKQACTVNIMTTGTNKVLYLKDVYIFSTCLSVETMREIYNHDNA